LFLFFQFRQKTGSSSSAADGCHISGHAGATSSRMPHPSAARAKQTLVRKSLRIQIWTVLLLAPCSFSLLNPQSLELILFMETPVPFNI
jgi:hypothetical protein